jgi:TonB family protein
MKLPFALAAISIVAMAPYAVLSQNDAPVKPDVYSRPGATSCSPSRKPEPNFKNYMSILDKALTAQFVLPEGHKALPVVVSFKIHQDGTITHLEIAKSSTDALVDKAALTAVERLAKFNPLPKGSPEAVSIQFKFDDKLLKSKQLVGDFES